VADPFVIETRALHKRYQTIAALAGLDLQVPSGAIHAFLGRNGAGKTTTIKILLGMARPTSGDARVFGLAAGDEKASVAIRRRTAFVSEDKDLYDYMTAEEIIRFTAGFYPRWRRDLEQRYVRRFELKVDQRIRTLSRGTRTKLALLLALCRGAELLVLDEPTSGLDPAAAEEVLQLLVSSVAAGETTVFFSSHQIGEVDQIADRITIIDRGRSVVAGPLDELRDRCRRIQLVFDGDAPEPRLRAPGIERMRRHGRVVEVLSSAGVDQVVAEARALNPVSIDVAPLTLKEIFLEFVNREEL
jgi:ABC-2 type transport system ATP-binding protein